MRGEPWLSAFCQRGSGRPRVRLVLVGLGGCAAEGVIVVQKNPKIEKHPEIPVPNLHVMMVMRTLKSKDFCEEMFNWQHNYYTLKNEGVEYLREYLRLPPSVFPATLTKKTSARPQRAGADAEGGAETENWRAVRLSVEMRFGIATSEQGSASGRGLLGQKRPRRPCVCCDFNAEGIWSRSRQSRRQGRREVRAASAVCLGRVLSQRGKLASSASLFAKTLFPVSIRVGCLD